MNTAIEPSREALISLIDWVQFTIPFTNDLEVAYDLLKMPSSEFLDMPKGLYRYAKQKACGNIRILYQGLNGEMGIHVQMSGQGCREYESYYGDGWESLFERVAAAGAKFSRLDLAVDEKRYNGDKPFFTLRQMIAKVKRNECRSKFKKARRIETLRIESGKSEGQTIYFGSPLSNIQMRVYEKDYERMNADQELEQDLTTWNRIEIQLSDQLACSAVNEILGGIPSGQIIFRLLSNYADFVDRQKNDTNKARWPRTKWWQLFLDNAERLRLAREAPDRTIPQKQSWIDKQVLPTFAEIYIALGKPDFHYFVDLINAGMERMTEAQWARAEAFYEEMKREESRLKDIKEERYQTSEEVRFNEIMKRRMEYKDKEKDQQDS